MKDPIHDTAEQIIAKVIGLRINQADHGPTEGRVLFEQLIATRYPGLSMEAVSVTAMINSVEAKLRKAEETDTANIQHWIEVGQMDLFNSEAHKLPPWISDPDGQRQATLDATLARVRADMQRRVEAAQADSDKLAEQWRRMQDRTAELGRYLTAIDHLVANALAAGLNPEEVTYAEIIAQANQADGGSAASTQSTPKRHLSAVRSAP